MMEIGQGIETTLSQVVADELTVRPEDVRVVYGDTDTVPYGLGAWSSRGASYSVSSAVMAARKVKEKILKVAAQLMEVPVGDVELADGGAQVTGVPEKRMSLAEIGRAVYMWPGPYVTVPEGEEPGLEATAYFTGPMVRWVPDEVGTLSLYTTHPTGCFGAIVEVDPDTGKVTLERFAIAHDCGVLINPAVVEGQIAGGIVQGIGGALFEELRYNSDGHLLNRGFRDYLVPTMADVPEIEIAHLVSPSPFTPLGTKGMGEGGAIGAPTAVINAVQDALAPFDITIRETPMSPDRLLPMIKAARAAGKGG
jgi:carbon-monoxide dehydrogenase large subunit